MRSAVAHRVFMRLLLQGPTGGFVQLIRMHQDTRSRPDMTNDPSCSQTDDVLDNFEELAASFSDCRI